MDTMQFYPTPENLIKKMWFTFKNRHFQRILEPSAGDGRLLKFHESRLSEKVDACEINMDLHPVLREKEINVVGFDFLELREGSIYSHIMMNPPFKDGAEHLIHAWNILYEGEIVCLLNAETLKNPFSRKRDFLNSLIEKHGTVEFIQDAFLTEDTERKTGVEVALVHLTKKAEEQHDFLDGIISELDRDTGISDDSVGAFQELAIPANVVENAVKAFDAAWAASKESIIVENRAAHYRRILGKSLSEMQRGHAENIKPNRKSLHQKFEETYNDLKDRGWTYVLRGTEVQKMTSSQVQRDLESRFEEVKRMSFTVRNIYGFLQGLAMNKGQIQIDMACEMFDSITRYHSENTVYYMGWKSNDHHRTAGMRIKTRRFVLPGFSTEGWQRNLGYNQGKQLQDMDKVFAMLDGKDHPYFGLVQAFDRYWQDLRNGKRIKTDYFDVRYYPGIGTIHFFPNNEKILNRLNIMVGRARCWIPDDVTPEADTPFWKQYHEAENFNKDINLTRNESWSLTNYNNDQVQITVTEKIKNAMEKHGYSTDFTLTGPAAEEKSPDQAQLLLIA